MLLMPLRMAPMAHDTSDDANAGHEHYMPTDKQWKNIDSILGPHK